MNQQAIDRLQLKNPAEAIIERVEHDFNLAPMVARTLFEQMRGYFESYYQLKNDSGQLTYLAIYLLPISPQRKRDVINYRVIT